METYEILKYPDKRLFMKASAVEEIEFDNNSLGEIVEKMFATMTHYKGIGLAATQVNIHKRIIVIEIDEQQYTIINPEIMKVSEVLAVTREGCLSVPQVNGDVSRPETISVRYRDIKGNYQEIHATGLLATCIQHEIDHLNGIVYVDRMKGLKRNMLLRKYDKINKY